MASLPFLDNGAGPPWLPNSVTEARRFTYWAQLISFIFFFVWLVFGIISIVAGQWAFGIYLLVSGFIDLMIVFLLKTTVFDTIDQGRFNEASDRLLIWGILGIIFGIIPGIFLIVAFLKIQESFQPQYQPYPPQQPGQSPPQPPPQQPGQSPPQPPTPSNTQGQVTPQVSTQPEPTKSQQQSRKQKHEMVKCKNCGVQYPAFMRTCPNCGEPREREE
jgi:ribosomal protein L32